MTRAAVVWSRRRGISFGGFFLRGLRTVFDLGIGIAPIGYVFDFPLRNEAAFGFRQNRSGRVGHARLQFEHVAPHPLYPAFDAQRNAERHRFAETRVMLAVTPGVPPRRRRAPWLRRAGRARCRRARCLASLETPAAASFASARRLHRKARNASAARSRSPVRTQSSARHRRASFEKALRPSLRASHFVSPLTSWRLKPQLTAPPRGRRQESSHLPTSKRAARAWGSSLSTIFCWTSAIGILVALPFDRAPFVVEKHEARFGIQIARCPMLPTSTMYRFPGSSVISPPCCMCACEMLSSGSSA